MKYTIRLLGNLSNTNPCVWTAVPAPKLTRGIGLFSKKDATARAKKMNRELFLFIAEQSQSLTRPILTAHTIVGLTKEQDLAALKRHFNSPEVQALIRAERSHIPPRIINKIIRSRSSIEPAFPA